MGRVMEGSLKWVFVMDFENDRICRACGEPNHHGYLLVHKSVKSKEVKAFVCHPCSEDLASAVIDEWNPVNHEEED